MRKVFTITTSLIVSTIVIGVAEAEPPQSSVDNRYHERNTFENPREGRLDNRKKVVSYGFNDEGDYVMLEYPQSDAAIKNGEATYKYDKVADTFEPSGWQSSKDVQAARAKSVGLTQ